MKKILSIIMSVVMILTVCFSCVSCKNYQTTEPGTADNELVIDNTSDEYQVHKVMLMSDGATTVSDDVLTTTLTATVLPENAPDKSVDWSVAWSNPEGTFESDKSVTDYVTVTPASDGATTATVTVLQPFADSDVIVTVTTRNGGYKASTTVKYIGVPNAIEVITTGDVVDGKYAVPSNSTTTYDIKLSNIFGESTDTYYSDYADLSISIRPYGNATFSAKKVDGSSWVDAGTTTIGYSELITYGDYSFDATIVDGKIQIVAGNYIDSITTLGKTVNGIQYKYTLQSIDSLCYLTLTVTDNNTGISVSQDFYISNSVSSVSLDSSELLF